MKDFLRIVGFTLVETVGLSLWLALTAVSYLASVGVLFAFLFVEHVLNINTTLNRRLLDLDRVRGILGFTTTETVAWVVWLLLIPFDPILAATVLAGLLLVEHNQADNTLLLKPFFGGLLRTKALGHTLIEVVGCTGWLTLVRQGNLALGVGVLFAGLLLHHALAVRQGRKALVAG